MTKQLEGKSTDDIICENRVYECLGCGFVGRELEAEEHQLKCDNPMKLLANRRDETHG